MLFLWAPDSPAEAEAAPQREPAQPEPKPPALAVLSLVQAPQTLIAAGGDIVDGALAADANPSAAAPAELPVALRRAAWQLAGALLNRRLNEPDPDHPRDGLPIAPPPGHRRLTTLARMVGAELRCRERSVQDDTVRSYISEDVKEWERKNPSR